MIRRLFLSKPGRGSISLSQRLPYDRSHSHEFARNDTSGSSFSSF
jgi:hypothetical protein